MIRPGCDRSDAGPNNQFMSRRSARQAYSRLLLVAMVPPNVTNRVTWIDANAPYYGIYGGKKNLKRKGTPDFRPPPLARK